MPSILSRLTGIFEIALSVFGAGLLLIQTLSGADGVAQIAAALVTLIAPICAAVRSTSGEIGDIANTVADTISETLSSQNDAD